MENKTGKGWLKLAKNQEITEHTGENLSLEDFIKALQNLHEDTLRQKREVEGYRFCIEQGWISFGGLELNLCSNPECKSCRMFDEAIKKEVSSLPFTLTDKNFIGGK